MANTTIQIKFSEVTAVPPSLNVAEPAYSYTSNTLFIGTPDSTGAIAIGGKSYVDLTTSAFAKANSANVLAQAAYDAANAAGSGATITAAFAKANAANILAQAGFDKANTANVTADAAFAKANSANVLAQQAYDNSNTKLSLSGGTITGPISGLGNSKLDFTTYGSNTAYLTTTNDDSTALFMGAGSAELYANTSVTIRANTKGTSQNWTFGEDGSLTLPASGIISGLKDLNVTGNLTVVGQTVYANTQTVLIKDNIITLNAAISQSGTPIANAGIEIDRGSSANASLIWDETNDKWVFSSDGTTYYGIADAGRLDSAFTQANSANVLAQAAFDAANSASATAVDSIARVTANAAFDKANSANVLAQAAFNYANNISLTGNTINLGSNTVGQLVSNAVTLTTATKVTDGLALINNVLGKLVPASPTAFPGATGLSISSLSTYRMTNFVQTDNTTTGGKSVAGGSTVTSVRRASSYTTNTFGDLGPGDSGNLSLQKNNVSTGNVTFSSTTANGTYSNLIITDSVDYSVKSGGAAGFWRSFDAQGSGTVSAGWNEIYLAHTGASNTATVSWYYDSSAPGTPTFASASIVPLSPSLTYSSTIPHYNSSTTFRLGVNVSKLSGDMFPTSNTFFTGTAGGAFQAPASNTYSGVGITYPLAQNLYVSSGNVTVNTTASITTGFGSSSTGPTVTVDNSYATGSQVFTTALANTVLYKTGTASSMEETTITFSSTVGTGSGLAARIINPGTTDTPTFTASASLFDSQSSTLTANDATIVAATLKHDQTNYSTTYLPVGPNLSTGRTGSQYFTFRFVRTSVSKFDIQFTGTIAGLFVALPGSTIDTSSTLNGWLDMSTAYAGSGVPGAGSGGNGSNGCAVGGVVTLNSAVTAHRKTCTFGTLSSSSTATNEIYVRIKLTSGQTVSALTLQTASN
jgi:hypothetical protein